MRMAIAPSGHIELFTDDATLQDVHAWLAEAGYDVSVRPLRGPHAMTQAALFVVDGGQRHDDALKVCQQLHGEQNGSFTPILFIRAAAASRLASLQSGADSTLARPIDG